MLPYDVAENWKEKHNIIRAERAREAGLLLVASDVIGERDGCRAYGSTAIISPGGIIASEVPINKAQIIYQDIEVNKRIMQTSQTT